MQLLIQRDCPNATPMQADAAYHSQCTAENNKNVQEINMGRNGPVSPIHSPPVLIQELLTSRLERIVRPQIINRHRDTSERIDTRFLNVLDDTDAIKAVTCRRNDRIVHDLECNAVNQPVRHNLQNVNT